MAYRKTIIEQFDFTVPKNNMPVVIDDMSLAFHLGIRNKTLWYLLRGSRIAAGDFGSLYHEGSILKRGKAGKQGKRRLIHIPDPRLKSVQKALDVRFVQNIPVGDHVRAYEKGRIPVDTARMCADKGILLSMDLKNFFGTIRRAWIRRLFLEQGYSRYVAGLMAQLCCCTTTDTHATPEGKKTIVKTFMPQGTSVSPSVSNRVANIRFDHKILDIANETGWSYFRYSDNIYMAHDDVLPRETVDAFKQSIIDIINKAGWQVHKIRVTPKWRRQEVLGLVVNEHANVKNTEYRAIRALIHNCKVDGFESQVTKAKKHIKVSIDNPESLKAHIRGRLSYLGQVLCESRKDKLLEEFDDAVEAEKLRVEKKWRAEDALDAQA